jgi:hypothetical protein
VVIEKIENASLIVLVGSLVLATALFVWSLVFFIPRAWNSARPGDSALLVLGVVFVALLCSLVAWPIFGMLLGLAKSMLKFLCIAVSPIRRSEYGLRKAYLASRQRDASDQRDAEYAREKKWVQEQQQRDAASVPSRASPPANPHPNEFIAPANPHPNESICPYCQGSGIRWGTDADHDCNCDCHKS